ncbi:MAG TPA: TIR domain-containing protein [Thermoanaerobaculia bacterium]|nr:TIR domain-containing protein [Thermoanaerobaculia bacterium]
MIDFEVALSFAEEHRGFVETVAEKLAAELTRARVFFYPFHPNETRGRDHDLFLQKLYGERSRLVVAFLDEHYGHKPWCLIEWRAIRNLLNGDRADSVMLVRLDDGEIPGLLPTDGWTPAHSLNPAAVADLILSRLRAMEGTEKGEVPRLPPPQPPTRISRRTILLAVFLAVLLPLYGVLLSKNWREMSWALPNIGATETSIGSDAVALNLLAEALVAVRQDRFSDAYQTSIEAEKSARTLLGRDRAVTLRLLLAAALSEGHQMAGETLAEGKHKAQATDQTRYAELAIGQQMQAFKWAKEESGAMGVLASRNLPEVRFPTIELSNPMTDVMTRGIKVREHLASGAGAPSDQDVDLASKVLVAQVLRFYVARTLQPEAGQAEALYRNEWSGLVHWSPGLTDAPYQHLVKLADKGTLMVRTVDTQPPESRFNVGQSFGLGQDLDLAFCRSLLEGLRQFLTQAQTRAATAAEAAHLAAIGQDVDRRLPKLVPSARR